MNRKQLIIAVVVCAVLGVLGWVASNQNRADYGSNESAARVNTDGNKLFPKFPVNEVALLTIRQKTNELSLVKILRKICERVSGVCPDHVLNASAALNEIYERRRRISSHASDAGVVRISGAVREARRGRIRGHQARDRAG